MSELLFTMADLEAAYDGGFEAVDWSVRKQGIMNRSIERCKIAITEIEECIETLEEEKKYDHRN